MAGGRVGWLARLFGWVSGGEVRGCGEGGDWGLSSWGMGFGGGVGDGVGMGLGVVLAAREVMEEEEE